MSVSEQALLSLVFGSMMPDSPAAGIIHGGADMGGGGACEGQVSQAC